MNKLIGLSLLALVAFTSHTYAGVLRRRQNDLKTKVPLSRCKSAVKIIDAEFPDTVACPKVVTYKFNEALSANELKMIVGLELNYLLKDKVSDWATLLAESFDLQTGFAAENLSEGSGQYADKMEKKLRKAIKDADASVLSLSKILILKGKALGAKIYVDPDTSWGPKVKAKAVLILNAPHKTVEVYLHGDLDG